MISFLLGVLAACGASVMLNLGVVLQAIDARKVSDQHALRLSLLGRLLRRPYWLAGTVLGYLAVPMEVLALAHAPLVVVEPLLGSGLLLLLVMGRRLLDERIGRAQAAGMCAIVAGLGLVAWGGPPGNGVDRGETAVILVIGLIGVVALMPYLLPRRSSGVLLIMIASAAGFSAANMAINELAQAMHLGDYLACAAWLGVAGLTGLAATVGQMTAFQRRPATEVVPVTFVVPNFLPVVLAPLFLSDHWGASPLGGGVLAIGVILSLLGTLSVGRSRHVTTLATATA